MQDTIGAGLVGLVFLGVIIAFGIAAAIMPFVVLSINGKLQTLINIQREQVKYQLRHDDIEDSEIDSLVNFKVISKYDADYIRKFRRQVKIRNAGSSS